MKRQSNQSQFIIFTQKRESNSFWKEQTGDPKIKKKKKKER